MGWHVNVVMSDSAIDVIYDMVVSAGTYTVRTDAASLPDPSVSPLPTLSPPLQRWLQWEQRAMVPRRAGRGAVGSPETCWSDTGPGAAITSHGQVLVPTIGGGVTLHVNFAVKAVNFPPWGVVNASGNWWVSVLYS